MDPGSLISWMEGYRCNGQWAIDNGQEAIGNGQLAMGKLQMANELRTTNYELENEILYTFFHPAD